MRAACDLAARVVGFLPLRRIDMSDTICDHPDKSEFYCIKPLLQIVQNVVNVLYTD